MSRIEVTRAFLPPVGEYQQQLARIWETGQLTNQGPLIREFEERTRDYLGLADAYLHVVANGTLALQLALRSLQITDGEVITTPFTYVATASSILWEHCTPVFVDIEPDTLCLDASLIEAALTPRTRAIMPVHVFGNAPDVAAIDGVARAHGLPVIYDGAHAFGARLHGRSLLSYGDVATTSFHATKPFHTIEGGALITRDPKVHERVELLKRFGHNADDHVMLGINAKTSEFNAAMGLVNLRHIDSITARRKVLVGLYDELLAGRFDRPTLSAGLAQNYSYYPILFASETELLRAIRLLNARDVYPRRYFHPSLDTLPYLLDGRPCRVSRDVATRILCLPLYAELSAADVELIVSALPA